MDIDVYAEIRAAKERALVGGSIYEREEPDDLADVLAFDELWSRKYC